MINDTTRILQPFFQEQCNPYFYSNTRAASLHTMHRSNYTFLSKFGACGSFWVCISITLKQKWSGIFIFPFIPIVQLPSLVSHCSNWRCCCLITTTIFSLTSLAMIPGMFDEQDRSWKWNEEVRSPCFLESESIVIYLGLYLFCLQCNARVWRKEC